MQPEMLTIVPRRGFRQLLLAEAHAFLFACSAIG